MLERLGSFFSGNDKPQNSSQDLFDVSKLPGVEPKVMHGLGFSVAAQVIAKEITCRARIKAHLEYKLPFSDMDPEVQKAHDREINEIADFCREEWEDIADIIIDDWNPRWEFLSGLFVYGKPDIRVKRKCGEVYIGDAKT